MQFENSTLFGVKYQSVNQLLYSFRPKGSKNLNPVLGRSRNSVFLVCVYYYYNCLIKLIIIILL